jgi:hypothetical protein
LFQNFGPSLESITKNTQEENLEKIKLEQEKDFPTGEKLDDKKDKFRDVDCHNR